MRKPLLSFKLLETLNQTVSRVFVVSVEIEKYVSIHRQDSVLPYLVELILRRIEIPIEFVFHIHSPIKVGPRG